MSQILNWKIIAEKINTETWAKELYDQTMSDLDWFINNYHDEATRVTGWFHHYNCEKCQGRLLFNIKDETTHICSICGHKIVHKHYLMYGITHIEVKLMVVYIMQLLRLILQRIQNTLLT